MQRLISWTTLLVVIGLSSAVHAHPGHSGNHHLLHDLADPLHLGGLMYLGGLLALLAAVCLLWRFAAAFRCLD